MATINVNSTQPPAAAIAFSIRLLSNARSVNVIAKPPKNAPSNPRQRLPNQPKPIILRCYLIDTKELYQVGCGPQLKYWSVAGFVESAVKPAAPLTVCFSSCCYWLYVFSGAMVFVDSSCLLTCSPVRSTISLSVQRVSYRASVAGVDRRLRHYQLKARRTDYLRLPVPVRSHRHEPKRAIAHRKFYGFDRSSSAGKVCLKRPELAIKSQ